MSDLYSGSDLTSPSSLPGKETDAELQQFLLVEREKAKLQAQVIFYIQL